MSATATTTFDDVLVAFEGVSRLRWRRVAAAQWVPTGIWPDDSQAGELAERLECRQPLLVLIDCRPARVEVMCEEFAAAPPCIAALATEAAADVVTLEIPFLDWLPAGLRRRGVAFARAAAHQIACTPRGLLPDLLLEPVAADQPWIRFGCSRSSRIPADLGLVARAAFQILPCPGSRQLERQDRAS